MSLFKEGDKVVLKPREDGWENEHPHYIDSMEEMQESGIVFTVGNHGHMGNVKIYSEGDYWYAKEEWVEYCVVSMENE